jgi:hypothetical protein
MYYLFLFRSSDPNYVPDGQLEKKSTSPRKSKIPEVDEKDKEPASFSPRSGKADTHSAYNEKNFYGVPTPSKSMQIQLNLVPGLTKSAVYLFTVLTDEDLEEDAN